MGNLKIGIDPGLSGAIAIVGEDFIDVHDMPLVAKSWSQTSKYKNRVEPFALHGILTKHLEGNTLESINIEIVGAMPGQGVSSMWAFSGAFYAALTVAEFVAGDRPLNMILPSQWKKKYGLINMPKDAARLACLTMYPFLVQELKRKKDVDRADAILIAGY